MHEKNQYKALLPEDLYKQIEQLYDSFVSVQNEVSGIVSNNQMTDSAAHLEDVIQSTEAATHTVLDAATAVQMVVESGVGIAEIQKEITQQVGKIYEACNFQDISSQRIRKVLKHLDILKNNLVTLAQNAKAYASGEVVLPNKTDPFLNGPQLSSVAPTQDEIDRLFNQENL